MSIEEIKDIKKLQQMLKSELELRKYTYKCCQEAGEELAKNSLSWDGKEKNLVIQAMELNERFEAKKQECEELKKKKEESTTFYLTKYANKDSECEELQHKVNVLSEALIRVNEIAQGVRNYLTCPSPRDVRYEMDLILSKVKECNIESNKDDN